MNMLAVDAVIFTSQSGFTTADKSFKAQNLLCVCIALFLILQKSLHHLVAMLDNLVAAISKYGIETIDEVHESAHLLIAYSDIS